MARKRHKGHKKGEKREAGTFVAFPHGVLRSAEFASLSPFAVKLLCDLLSQYRGDNNGDLCATWSLMRPRGWNSKATLAKTLKELLKDGFLVVTRQGGRHRPTLLALAWYEIDYCNGKLDLRAPTRTFMGTWRRTTAAPVVVAHVSRAPRGVAREAQLPHLVGQALGN